MGRHIGSVCRLCRREGEKLFLKGERCYTQKCAMERRQGGPGQHGRARTRASGFKTQLREKQKLRRIFNIREEQFERYMYTALNSKGVTGTELLVGLERRLDNLVAKVGFSSSRAHGRQLVSHGHVKVNGRSVTIPSYSVKVGDVVELAPKTKESGVVKAALKAAESRPTPGWLAFDKDAMKVTVSALPKREECVMNVNEQPIIELYS